MFSLLPLWLQIVFFIIGNAPNIIKLLIEIRKLMKDVPQSERMAVMQACKEDLEEYKKNKNMPLLLEKMKAKKTRHMMAKKSRHG